MKKKLLLSALCLMALGGLLYIQNPALTPNLPSLRNHTKIWSPRPIAEFEPSYAVAISEQILFRQSGIELVKALIKAKAKVYIFVTAALKTQVEELFKQKKTWQAEELDSIHRIDLEHDSPWLRDYLPIPLLRVYPHLPPTPSFVDFVFRDGNSYDDAAIHQFALTIDASIEHLPIVMDGGNFISNGETCIVSEEMADERQALQKDAADFQLGKHIGEIFSLALGCRKTIIVSQLPHPHVDMFLKFINKDTILINEIEDRSLAFLSEASAEDQVKIPKIKTELDRIANNLNNSFRVLRVPMPLPVNGLFITYVNSVIVNDTVIIPSYKIPDSGRGNFPDLGLYASYEDKVTTIYRRLGLKTVLLGADDLIKDGGAFHCVTFHLPDLDAIVPDTSHLAAKPKP